VIPDSWHDLYGPIVQFIEKMGLKLVPYQPKTCQKKQENFHTGLEILI